MMVLMMLLGSIYCSHQHHGSNFEGLYIVFGKIMSSRWKQNSFVRSKKIQKNTMMMPRMMAVVMRSDTTRTVYCVFWHVLGLMIPVRSRSMSWRPMTVTKEYRYQRFRGAVSGEGLPPMVAIQSFLYPGHTSCGFQAPLRFKFKMGTPPGSTSENSDWK